MSLSLCRIHSRNLIAHLHRKCGKGDFRPQTQHILIRSATELDPVTGRCNTELHRENLPSIPSQSLSSLSPKSCDAVGVCSFSPGGAFRLPLRLSTRGPDFSLGDCSKRTLMSTSFNFRGLPETMLALTKASTLIHQTTLSTSTQNREIALQDLILLLFSEDCCVISAAPMLPRISPTTSVFLLLPADGLLLFFDGRLGELCAVGAAAGNGLTGVFVHCEAQQIACGLCSPSDQPVNCRRLFSTVLFVNTNLSRRNHA